MISLKARVVLVLMLIGTPVLADDWWERDWGFKHPVPTPVVPPEIAHFEEVKTLAESGNIDAELELAELFERGIGVGKSYSTAFEWWKRAADRGSDIAQNNVGAAFLSGVGTTKNNGSAVVYYTLSAAQSNAIAQAELGWLYFKGRGVAQDKDEAIHWWLMAAEKSAKARLGLFTVTPGRKLTDGEHPIYGHILNVLYETEPGSKIADRILYLNGSGDVCKTLNLAEASSEIQSAFGFTQEKAAAFYAARNARIKAEEEARAKAEEEERRRVLAMYRLHQIDELNYHLGTLTGELREHNWQLFDLNHNVNDLNRSVNKLNDTINFQDFWPVR